MGNRLRVLSLFSGIGAIEMAIKQLGYEIDLDNYCEYDKYAAKAYALLHDVPESLNVGDITAVDETKLKKNPDLVCYGFPCQDLSNAGLKRGFLDENGNKTRSGTVVDALRIIEATQPRIAIAENVKGLLSKKFRDGFDYILSELDRIGYNSSWMVLNATDFGIPQNRERIFIVSIRKDIPYTFAFPLGFPLENRLRDFLEPEVDDKYYLSSNMIRYINQKALKEHNFRVAVNSPDGVLQNPLRVGGDKAVINVGNIYEEKGGFPNRTSGRVYSSEGVAPTLKTPSGGGATPIIVDKKILEVGNTRSGGERSRIISPEGICTCLTSTDYKQPTQIIVEPCVLKAQRSEHGKEVRKAYDSGQLKEAWAAMKEMVPRTDGITNTITSVQKDNIVVDPVMSEGKKLRKLTPRECLRLQGFSDKDADILYKNFSDTQIYKRAGNAICVPVAYHILLDLKEKGIL